MAQVPPQKSGGSAFQKALERFKHDHLNAAENEQFQFTDLASLKSAMKNIQDEQASNRNRKMLNMPRLRKFLEGMEQYEKLIEVFLNSSEFLPFVWVSDVSQSLPFFSLFSFWFESPVSLTDCPYPGPNEVPSANYQQLC
jgi:hypothetical protein